MPENGDNGDTGNKDNIPDKPFPRTTMYTSLADTGLAVGSKLPIIGDDCKIKRHQLRKSLKSADCMAELNRSAQSYNPYTHYTNLDTFQKCLAKAESDTSKELGYSVKSSSGISYNSSSSSKK